MTNTPDIETTRPMLRNIALLVSAQALLLTAVVGAMALSGLAGRALSSDPSLATLPIAAMLLGSLFISWPASMFMARHGRRRGFIIGSLLGVGGGALAAVAIAWQHFWLFCLAHLLIGSFQGFANYYRFAAMEAANDAFRHRAMSFVLAGGVFAAIAGPWLSQAMRHIGPAEFFGTYLSIFLLCIASLAVVDRLRLPPPPAPASDDAPPRALRHIVSSAAFTTAVVSAAVAYSIMILAMTATPLAMSGCGLPAEDARAVIQWHVLGMFVPSFFTGKLIQRFGAARIALAGMALLAAHVVVALSGVTFLQFASALLLLGAGWNFAFLGGTALLGLAHTSGERASAQAANELIVFGCAAAASLSAGWLLAQYGWQTLNLVLLAPLGLGILTLLPAVLRPPSLLAAPAALQGKKIS